MKFPMEVYNPQGAHKVVFGPEEYAAAKAEGWADERPEAAHRSAGDHPSVYKSEVTTASESQDSTAKRRGRPPKVQSIGEVA